MAGVFVRHARRVSAYISRSMSDTTLSTEKLGHGGILFPLDMFRPTMLASIVGEAFVAKARNVLDAEIELTRHPQAQLVLLRMHGSIVGDDPAHFWRENIDLGLILSQVLPRQLFLYYVGFEPQRQGFMVAQQGQALAGDDVDESSMPPEAQPEDWPVARLCAQLRLGLDELASGFAGGPTVRLPVVDVVGDDRELLETLIGPLEPEAAQDHEAPPAGAREPAPSSATAAPGPANAGARTRSTKDLAAEAAADQKRRAAEREAEAAARAALAAEAKSGLEVVVDELGAVVAPPGAELGDADILGPFVVRKLSGDVPDGMPRELAESLQGKRIDIAVKVDFFSELLIDGKPLAKADFEREAKTLEVDGLEFRVLACHAPRLSAGSLWVRNKGRVFVSREPDAPVPAAIVLSLAGITD